MAGKLCCNLLYPFIIHGLLLLIVSLSVTRGLSVQSSRVSRPCAGDYPAGPVYLAKSKGPTRDLWTSYVLQSYLVTQAIDYVDSLLSDYIELNRVTGFVGTNHCQTSTLCDMASPQSLKSQVSCAQLVFKRLANDIIMVEKIYQAEYEYEMIINTPLSYKMNHLKETLYTLLCDLENTFQRKQIGMVRMAGHISRETFYRNLKRFQRDYAALLCIRTSLLQTKDDFQVLEKVGFFA